MTPDASNGQPPPLAICGGVRTPYVRSFGQYQGVTPDDLATAVFAETISRSGIDPGLIDEVVLGCAGQPLKAMNVGRVAALRAGVPEHVPGVTVHRNCASGIEAIHASLRRIRSLEADLVLVGGTECMSAAPFIFGEQAGRKMIRLGSARSFGTRVMALLKFRPRDFIPHDVIRPALTDPISGLLMGMTAEVLAREFDISRQEQDEYAAESHRRCIRARELGVFREESMPFLVPPSFGRAVEEDDGIRTDSTLERLSRLRPVFEKRFGTVTVGNACQITDGAGALLMSTPEKAEALGIPVLGLVRDAISVGCDPRRMGLGPAIAIPRILERNKISSGDIGLFEINEAFAVQVLACLRLLGDDAPSLDRVNVNGGAIALGHPVGATGVRIVHTLLLEMRRRGERYGIASLCVGGGQGSAVLLENPGAL